VDEDTLLLVMSDHGFGLQEKYLQTNIWLWQQGYLSFKQGPLTQARERLFRLGFAPANIYEALRSLRRGAVDRVSQRNKGLVLQMIGRIFLSFRDVDWHRTQAYSVGNIGPIYANLRGREPQGIVDPGHEYETLLGDLAYKLAHLRDPDSGEPIRGQVYRREEVFEGPHLDHAPDLIFLAEDMRYTGFGLFDFPTNAWMSAADRSGGHRMDGLLLMYGPGCKAGHELPTAHLVDLAPTLLAAMGVPIPTDMDGHVLLDAFTPDLQSTLQLRYQASRPELVRTGVDLSSADEDEILDRLRGLGYVD
jgi:predicted AlkP superfamily phosphohydrolase/phosphomutase